MAFAYKVKGRQIELFAQDVVGYHVTPTSTDAKVNGLKFEVTQRADITTQKVSTATASLNASGMGANTYTNLTCTGGSGFGCKITAIVTADALTSFEITDGGKDYKAGDVLNFASSLATASSGTVTTFTLTVDTTANRTLTSDDNIDEGHNIDLPDYLAKALVYYVKGRLAEDRGDIDQKEYNFHQFEKMIDTYEETKTHGLSQTMVGNWGVRNR